ncbi:MAG: hypothetical protein QJR08_00390 [Bacillota bacterium]|nr:hypothetical protein [Bacillota bacterium]
MVGRAVLFLAAFTALAAVPPLPLAVAILHELGHLAVRRRILRWPTEIRIPRDAAPADCRRHTLFGVRFQLGPRWWCASGAACIPWPLPRHLARLGGARRFLLLTAGVAAEALLGAAGIGIAAVLHADIPHEIGSALGSVIAVHVGINLLPTRGTDGDWLSRASPGIPVRAGFWIAGFSCIIAAAAVAWPRIALLVSAVLRAGWPRP